MSDETTYSTRESSEDELELPVTSTTPSYDHAMEKRFDEYDLDTDAVTRITQSQRTLGTLMGLSDLSMASAVVSPGDNDNGKFTSDVQSVNIESDEEEDDIYIPETFPMRGDDIRQTRTYLHLKPSMLINMLSEKDLIRYELSTTELSAGWQCRIDAIWAGYHLTLVTHPMKKKRTASKNVFRNLRFVIMAVVGNFHFDQFRVSRNLMLCSLSSTDNCNSPCHTSRD